jgi:hypothetical protein
LRSNENSAGRQFFEHFPTGVDVFEQLAFCDRFAFIDTYIELESMLRKLAVWTGITPPLAQHPRAGDLMETLHKKLKMDQNTIDSFDSIRQLRNLIVHGRDVSDDAALSGLSVALQLKDKFGNLLKLRKIR